MEQCARRALRSLESAQKKQQASACGGKEEEAKQTRTHAAVYTSPSLPARARLADRYGLNILAIAAVNVVLMAYALRTPEIRNERLPPKVARQGRFRLWLNVLFPGLGIVATWVSLPLAIALFAFPVIFNIIPGTLTLTEKLLRIEI